MERSNLHKRESFSKNSVREFSAKKDAEVIKGDDIEKMRQKLESLSPDKLISDILKNTKKNSSLQPLGASQISILDRRDMFLENLKQTTMNNFIENMKTKNAKEMKLEFEKKLEEYNISTKLYRDKKDKELTEYINQIENYKIRIQELETAKSQLNEKNKRLEEDKKDKEDNIYKLQMKFVIFEKLKPIFEEFFKEYPDEDPKKIIEDITQKREAAVRIMEDMNLMRDKIFQHKKDHAEMMEKDRKTIEDLSEKLSQAEMNNKDKVEKYTQQINSLKSELSTYTVYKEENVKLQKMLFHLYNKLIERLKLDRSIELDPSLNVVEKDFKPDLMDNNELAQYIKTMLVNSHEEWSSKMLRETIAYANMMTRTHLKGKVNKRFDPVAIFKEIKEVLDKTKGTIKDHEKEKEALKEKISKFEIEVKKHERELKYKQLQYETLEKKFDEQFNRRQAKSKELRNNLHSARKINEIHKTPPLNEEDSREENQNLMQKIFKKKKTLGVNFEDVSDTTNSEISKKNSFDYSIIGKNNDSLIKKKNRAKSAHPAKKIKGKNKKNKDINNLFLTNQLRNIQSAKSRDIKSASTRPGTAKLVYLRPKTSLTLFKYNRQTATPLDTQQTNSAVDKLRSLTEGISYNNNSIIPPTTQNPNFKNLEMSKNKDKLTRLASYQVLPSHSDGFHSLVEHTNKMFLYKAKMKASEERINNNNIFKKFQNNMDNNFKKLDKVKKKAQGYESEIGTKIMGNINSMIRDLEKKE
jgi:hypothetical protein